MRGMFYALSVTGLFALSACGALLDIDGIEFGDATSTASSGGSAGSATVASVSSSSTGGGAICGNGVRDAGEECDGDDLAGETCESVGFDGGTLACNPQTCAFNTRGCTLVTCGNGTIDQGEQCDNSNLAGQTCVSLGMAGGMLACINCQFGGCYPHYTQDFEGMTLPGGWMTSGSSMWTVTSADAHGGNQCAESGPIADNETVTLSVSLTYDVAGSISFWHREQTELCCDFLEFRMDGNIENSWDGLNQWDSATFMVPAGTHTFSWTYTKDGGYAEPPDVVRIDDLAAQNGYMP